MQFSTPAFCGRTAARTLRGSRFMTKSRAAGACDNGPSPSPPAGPGLVPVDGGEVDVILIDLNTIALPRPPPHGEAGYAFAA